MSGEAASILIGGASNMSPKRDAPEKGRRTVATYPICYMYHERLWCLETESWVETLVYVCSQGGEIDRCALPHLEKRKKSEDE